MKCNNKFCQRNDQRTETGCFIYRLQSEVLICSYRESFDKYNEVKYVNDSVIGLSEELEQDSREYELRKLLWSHHGCPIQYLYGDDGELQCSNCRVDFKRDHPDLINQKFLRFTMSKPEVKEALLNLVKEHDHGKES